MSNPWFRMYKEFALDPVIQSLAFEDQRHYVVILCMKCDGVLDRNINSTAKERIILRTLGLDSVAGDEAKRRLLEVDLIDKKWQPKAWNKRQYISDNSTERVRKYRKSKETGNVTRPLQGRFCNAPDTEADTEADKKKILKEKGRFTPPTLNEVISYIDEKNYAIDADKFINFYQSKGWMVGKNKMKDWKACVRTWKQNPVIKQNAWDGAV